MNNKLKIALGTVLTTAIIATTGSAIAADDGYTTGINFQPATLYPYLSEEGDNFMYFCAEKGGPLRLGDKAVSDEVERTLTKYTETIGNQTFTNYVKDQTSAGNEINTEGFDNFDDILNYLTGSDETFKTDIFTGENEARFRELLRMTIDDMINLAYKVNDGDLSVYSGYSVNNPFTHIPRQFTLDFAAAKAELAETLNTYMGGNITATTNIAKYIGKKVAIKPTYTQFKNIVNKNNITSYILSSGLNADNNNKAVNGPDNQAGTNYQKTYSDVVGEKLKTADTTAITTVQHALWQDSGLNQEGQDYNHNIGPAPSEGTTGWSIDGMNLYNEAKAYKNFAKNSGLTGEYNNVNDNGIVTGLEDKVKFINNERATIIDRKNGCYIIGPYVMNYPDDPRYAYIENMWITYKYTENNNEQTGTLSKDNFEIIKNDGNSVYPRSGSEFYIKIVNDKININTTSIQVHASYRFLNQTASKYQRLRGTGGMYQYYGYVKINITRPQDNPEFWRNDEQNPIKANPKEFANLSTALSMNQEGQGNLTSKPDDAVLNPNTNLYERWEAISDIDDVDNDPQTKYLIKLEQYMPAEGNNGFYKLVTYYKLKVYFATLSWETGYRKKVVQQGEPEVYETYKAQETTRIERNTSTEYEYDLRAKLLGWGEAWELTAASTGANRKWLTTTLSSSNEVKLKTKIAGKVWVDMPEKNKETSVDGIYRETGTNGEGDKLMEGVEVTLFDYTTHTEIASTHTDSNGEYVFTDINPFGKYYVRFSYNAQYLEPTYYTSPTEREVVTVNNSKYPLWKDTSNGSDNHSDRITFNAKFKTIETSKDNYKHSATEYNQTFTRQELMGNKYDSSKMEYVTDSSLIPVINEFGNLIINEEQINSNTKLTAEQKAEYISKIKFVRDCQFYSYTMNPGTNAIDAYPGSEVIVLTNDRSTLQVKTGKLASHDFNTVDNLVKAVIDDNRNNLNKLYRKLDDKSMYINQGYRYRPEADIALSNDVSMVVTTINGTSETYNYGSKNDYKCFDCGRIGKSEELKYELNEKADYIAHCPCGSSNVKTSFEIEQNAADIKYVQGIYAADEAYDVDKVYGNKDEYGKTYDDELKVFVTYQVKVMNESLSTLTSIDEVANYFDKNYTYRDDMSCIIVNKVDKNGQKTVKVTGKPNSQYINKILTNPDNRLYVTDDISKYKVETVEKVANTQSRYTGKDKVAPTMWNQTVLYVDGLEGDYLLPGEEAYIYLTFEVNKDEDRRVILNEDKDGNLSSGLDIISEINGYSTKYHDEAKIPFIREVSGGEEHIVTLTDRKVGGEAAGLIDIDSNPGNCIELNKSEDDDDMAPAIQFVINKEPRKIEGTVWEDKRTETNYDKSVTGNGFKDENEPKINGVTVQLIELCKMDNGGTVEKLVKEVKSGFYREEDNKPIINYKGLEEYKVPDGDAKNGKYAFISFYPGEFIVRYIYGDSYDTVLTTTNNDVEKLVGANGKNKTSYNGQDYKSTIYQKGLGTYDGNNASKGYTYNISIADKIDNVSDAKDIWARREKVNEYNKINTNEVAEVLASYKVVSGKDKNAQEGLLNKLMENTAMIAETGKINITIEYNTEVVSMKEKNESVGKYTLPSIDLGLVERPKAQIEIIKNVENINITLSNGTVLFDSNQKAENLGWISNNPCYKYDKLMMKDMRSERSVNGLVEATMDKELMHGASLKVTYSITAINTGEVDYTGQRYYYTGLNPENIVTTTPSKVVDYVPNNLKFDTNSNKDWEIVTADKLDINKDIKEKLTKNGDKTENTYNTIIVTKDSNPINTALVPAIYNAENKVGEYKSETTLVLTQLLSTTNNSDDHVYTNKVELLKDINTVGRTMQYSIVGNLDPTGSVKELDESQTTVRIMQPFGGTLTYIIISVITIAGAAIIVTGIIFIKKKVLTK